MIVIVIVLLSTKLSFFTGNDLALYPKLAPGTTRYNHSWYGTCGATITYRFLLMLHYNRIRTIIIQRR